MQIARDRADLVNVKTLLRYVSFEGLPSDTVRMAVRFGDFDTAKATAFDSKSGISLTELRKIVVKAVYQNRGELYFEIRNLQAEESAIRAAFKITDDDMVRFRPGFYLREYSPENDISGGP